MCTEVVDDDGTTVQVETFRTKNTLSEQYRKFVGVEPVLTAESVQGEYPDGTDL